jgi:outer membrane murein-binding lipoprotein Lpp
MKKGLLGILVIALTIVGCQNYDDQFDSLNDKIASLSTEVSALKAIQTTVTALSTKLDELANSALSDEDLEEILKEVADVQSSVAAIEEVTTEVEDLNEEVDTILEKLGDILAANAFYDGNLTITNNGQLANAHELIKTDDDDPTLTVRGNVLVTIKATGGVPLDSIASVQKILTKIRSVQGTVTITSEVAASLPALTYVTGHVFI